ncbi:Rho-related protein Rac [Acrasis kona]|uniref:Rho-related protein Rac n=1 Tax=Acrasis kona TaxID=1008807 RepID=A0AAW2Z2T1_9EUKA
METSLKIVAVGDGEVGKTCMLVSYAMNRFPEDHIPTIYDNYNTNVMWNNHVVSLGLWDTAGQDDYDRLRPLSYPGTDCFLLVFSLVRDVSFVNIEHKWFPEIHHTSPDVPFVIVGNKLDMRDDITVAKELRDKNEKCITKEEGFNLAKKLGAAAYIECSAKSQQGLRESFEACIKCVCDPEKKKKTKTKNHKCNVL